MMFSLYDLDPAATLFNDVVTDVNGSAPGCTPPTTHAADHGTADVGAPDDGSADHRAADDPAADHAAARAARLRRGSRRTAYTGGSVVSEGGHKYTANYWSQGADPATHHAQYAEWTDNGICGPTTAAHHGSADDGAAHGDPDADADADRHVAGLGGEPRVRGRRPGHLPGPHVQVPAGAHVAGRLGAGHDAGPLATRELIALTCHDRWAVRSSGPPIATSTVVRVKPPSIRSAESMSDSYIAPSNPISRAGAGVVSGIAGGVLLGLVLTMFGHIRPIGDLVGKPSIEVGWTVLLVICAVAGALYGAFAGRSVSAQIVPAIGIGICYGGAVVAGVAADRGAAAAGRRCVRVRRRQHGDPRRVRGRSESCSASCTR